MPDHASRWALAALSLCILASTDRSAAQVWPAELTDFTFGTPPGFYTYVGSGATRLATGVLSVPDTDALALPGQVGAEDILGVDFDVLEWAGFWQEMLHVHGAPQDWSQRGSIGFWFHGTGSGLVYAVRISDNRTNPAIDTSERFDFEFPDDVAGWRYISMPFEAFSRATWQPDGAPNDGFGLTEVYAWAILLPVGSDVVYFDKFDLGERIVDDFEVTVSPGCSLPTGVDANGAPLGLSVFSGDGPVAVSSVCDVEIPGSDASNDLIQVDIDVATWGGVVRLFADGSLTLWQNRDWSAFKGMSLWIEGTGSGATLYVDVLDNRNPGSVSDDAERFTFQFVDDWTGWQLKQLPFAEFTRTDIGNGAPDDGFNLDRVHGWAFGALATGGPRSYRLDRVGLFLDVPGDPGEQSVCEVTSQVPVSECEALVDFYHATGGDRWTDRSGWLTTNTPCSWTGVRCDDGHVTAILLRQNNLEGALPAGLDRLSFLQGIDVWNNRLTGPLPEDLGSIPSLLFLELSINQFSGTLPESFGNLSALTWFSVWFNQLTGTVPASWSGMTSLQLLQLGRNGFSGALPSAIPAWTDLRELHLATNAFTGTIPPALGTLTKLTALGLNNNLLEGVVPLPVAQLCAAIGAPCGLHSNAASLCIPNSADYLAVGADPIGGIPLSAGCGNSAPTAVDDAADTAFDTAITIDVLSNDSDPDGDALTVTAIPTPASNGTAVITSAGSAVRYSPTPGFSGTDSFRYTVSDGQGESATATVTVTVAPQPTTSGNVSFSVDMNREIRLGNLRPGRRVGLMGSVAPLSWEVLTALTDGNGDGVYEVSVPFSLVSGTQVQYKFVISVAGTLTWEEGVGPGDFGNRVTSFTGSETLPTVHWNNVSGVASESGDALPTEFALSPVYPNPFNPAATVSFDMPETGRVEIGLYDAGGRLVRVLVDDVRMAGRHEVRLAGGDLPSGVYLVTMVSGAFRESRAVTLVK